MKDKENTSVSEVAVLEQKKLRVGSRAYMQALSARLPEVLDWQERIEAARGKDRQALLNAFEREFNFKFSTEKIAEIPDGYQEISIADLPKILDIETQSLQESVSEQKNDENIAAGSLIVNPDFKKDSAVIDEKRDEIINHTITDTTAIVSAATNKKIEKVDKKNKPNKNRKPRKDNFDHEAYQQGLKDLIARARPLEVDRQAYLDKMIKDNEAKIATLKEADDAKQAQVEEEIALANNILASRYSNDSAVVDTEEPVSRPKTLPAVGSSIDSVDDKKGADSVALESDKGAVVAADEKDKVAPDKKEEEKKIAYEALRIFAELRISREDLLTIPGFEKINPPSQIIIAHSLKSIALERAKNKVSEQQQQALAGKGLFARFGAAIANSFRLNKQNRESLLAQEFGSLAVHGADLTRLVNWAETFSLSAQEVSPGHFVANFVGDIDYDRLDDKQKQIVDDFNDAAAKLTEMPKYWQRKFDCLSQQEQLQSKDKEAVQYFLAKRDYRENRAHLAYMLGEKLKLKDSEVLQKLNQADAKIYLTQFMAANPELEKEWEKMLHGKSMLGKALAKENWKFIAGGYLARTALAIPIGIVALPAVAVGIGIWRGRERAKTALRQKDHFIDKKALSDSYAMVKRREILGTIRKIVPTEHALDPESWLVLKASSTDRQSYEFLLEQLKQIDKQLADNQTESIDRKTLKSVDLIEKLYFLLDQINHATDDSQKKDLLGRLMRRLEFNRDLFERGLVNFGSIEERSVNSLDFYQSLSKADLVLAGFDDFRFMYNEELAPENPAKHKAWEAINKTKERAEELLTSLEYFADQKIETSRRIFIEDQMISGAVGGLVFAGAGYALSHFAGNWINFNVKEAYHFLKNSFVTQPSGVTEAALINNQNISVNLDNSDLGQAASNDNITGTVATEAALPSGSDQTTLATETILADQKIAPETSLIDNLSLDKNVSSGFWSDKISNSGLEEGQYDSVWRSAREIFKNHAEELGYRGNLNNRFELYQWASTQTNELLAANGDLPDLVHDGDFVTIRESADGLIIELYASSGIEPDFLPSLEQAASNVADVASPDSADANELWADQAGAKLGLKPGQTTFAEENVIRANIGGDDVYVNTADNTYCFFNNQGDEVSGLLLDDSGHVINNLSDFLSEKLKASSLDAGDLSPDSDDAAIGDTSPANDVAAEGANNINETVSSTPDAQPDSQVAESASSSAAGNSDAESTGLQDNFDNIIANKPAAKGTIANVLENIKSQGAPSLRDKVLLEFISENNIKPEQNLTELLTDNVDLLKEMNNPEGSVLTYLYDLRQAPSVTEQALILNQYLSVMLKDLLVEGSVAKKIFEHASGRGAFSIGTGIGGKAESLVFTAGDQVAKFNFSVAGMKELLNFTRSMIK